MGGFLGGLGTLLGGFNVARRIDEEGFDFREKQAHEDFLRQRQEEEARQADEDRMAKIGAEVALGTPEGGDPDFSGLDFGRIPQSVAALRALGVAGESKQRMAHERRRREIELQNLRNAGTLGAVGARGEETRKTLETRSDLEANQPVSPEARMRDESYDARTRVMANRPVGGLGGVMSMSSEALDLAARYLHETGKMPSVGRGAANRTAIYNRMGEMYPGSNIALNAAEYGAGAGALKKITANRAAVEAFEETADKNSRLLEGFLEKIPDLGARPLNKAARTIQATFGDTGMAEFEIALQSVSNEYARIISNPNLSGPMSDAARREGALLLRSDATVGQILAGLRVLRAEAQNRRESFAAVEAGLTDSFGGGAAPAGASGSGTAEDPFVF